MTFQEDIREAVKTLRAGGIILYPTDTVWGIGCDATNEEAVAKIYALKQREDSKSMLVLVDGEGALESVVEKVPEVAWQLMEAAVSPLTIIYDKARGVAHNLPSGDGSLGVRITKEKYSAELCRRLRRPIVSTSANVSGKKAPANFSQISEDIIKGVDYVASYRREEKGTPSPSNIIKIGEGGLFKVIR